MASFYCPEKNYEFAFWSWKFVDLVKFICSFIHISFLKRKVDYIGEKLLLCFLNDFWKCLKFEYMQAQNGSFRISRAIMHSWRSEFTPWENTKQRLSITLPKTWKTLLQPLYTCFWLFSLNLLHLHCLRCTLSTQIQLNLLEFSRCLTFLGCRELVWRIHDDS